MVHSEIMRIVKKKDKWNHCVISYLKTLIKESDLLVSYQYTYTDANDEECPCLIVEIKEGTSIQKLISKIKQNVPCAKDICYDLDLNFNYRIWPRERI